MGSFLNSVPHLCVNLLSVKMSVTMIFFYLYSCYKVRLLVVLTVMGFLVEVYKFVIYYYCKLFSLYSIILMRFSRRVFQDLFLILSKIVLIWYCVCHIFSAYTRRCVARLRLYYWLVMVSSFHSLPKSLVQYCCLWYCIDNVNLKKYHTKALIFLKVLLHNVFISVNRLWIEHNWS